MRKQSLFIGFLVAFLLPAFALAAQAQVTLGVNSISPSTVDINAGDTVVWTNTSGTTQSVTGDDGSFQSGQIAAGGQFAATFNSTGTYNYYDDADGGAILGEVVVGGTSVPTSAQTTTYLNPNEDYTTGVSASSNTELSSLESELQSLIAEIDALEGNSSASVSGAPAYTSGGSCPQIGRVLSLGSSGSDVTSLQQFLGVSPVTGYYGTITQAAVEQWQAANNIISYGTPATTGYGVVGPRTEAAIRLSCSGESSSTGSASTANAGVVSGFLQVSPISGEAPLEVTVTATVNTADSCSGATYTLDFGDGTQEESIPVADGDCSQQNQSFTHTYEYGGTYTITLSSGTHSSTATVTVSGSSAPATTSTTTSTPTQATGSISALVSSGPAPLSTTFYVSCVSGLAYDVVFGDGSDLGGTGVSQSNCNGGLQAITHTYTAAGSYTAELVIFVQSSNGTVAPQTVATQTIVVSQSAAAAAATPPVAGPGTCMSTTGGSCGQEAETYSPPALTPDVGGNPLEVSLQYSYDTSGCEVSIEWGDGTSFGGSSCTSLTGQLQTYTQTHTYAEAGNYTITLDRASQSDAVGVSIAS